MNKTTYIAGKITGLPRHKVMQHFKDAEHYLVNEGYTVLNPTVLPPGLPSHADYMYICYSMIDVADTVCMLNNWLDSPGACRELECAMVQGKNIMYEE